MIELIFAIAIMGIVLMSVPNIIRTTQRSSYLAIQQEGINEASTHLNNILSYAWDQNDTNASYLPPLLSVNNGDPALDEIPATARRLGTPLQSSRTFLRSDGKTFTASAIGLDPGEHRGDENDIDDFNNEIYHLTLISSSGDSSNDYVERGKDIKIFSSVHYAGDHPSHGNYNSSSILSFNTPSMVTNGTTNIKFITVTLVSNQAATTPELEKKIVFKAFSCNIGGYKLDRSDF